MGLLESGLLGETKAGKLSTFDALHNDFTKVLLQGLELHWGEYSTGFGASGLSALRFGLTASCKVFSAGRMRPALHEAE